MPGAETGLRLVLRMYRKGIAIVRLPLVSSFIVAAGEYLNLLKLICGRGTHVLRNKKNTVTEKVYLNFSFELWVSADVFFRSAAKTGWTWTRPLIQCRQNFWMLAFSPQSLLRMSRAPCRWTRCLEKTVANYETYRKLLIVAKKNTRRRLKKLTWWQLIHRFDSELVRRCPKVLL